MQQRPHRVPHPVDGQVPVAGAQGSLAPAKLEVHLVGNAQVVEAGAERRRHHLREEARGGRGEGVVGNPITLKTLKIDSGPSPTLDACRPQCGSF